jgi:23S rRNA pseudouridine1911/1915/1917 synthase
MAAIQFLAEQGDAGKTVAEMLRRRFQLTWKQAKSLVDGGHIRIAGMGCTDAAQRIRRGNRVWIREGVVEKKPGLTVPRMPKKPGDKAEVKSAKSIPKEVQKPVAKRAQPVVVPTGLDLVYSDDDIAVVNKPAGITTMRHAEEAAEFGERGQTYLPKTVADFVPHMLGRPQSRVIAVHRIDAGTSGLVVFARNPAAAKSLTEQFKKHTVDRRYLALVRCGAPKTGRVESTLIPDRGDGRRGSAAPGVEHEDGKRAVTNIKLAEELGAFAAVECRLETGRTHQVRIHLGEAGHPLCGEKIYDRPIHGKPLPDGSGALRPMLHAVRLGLKHPTSHETMTWEEAPPADFASLWRKMRAVAKAAVV